LSFETAVDALSAIHKEKTLAHMSAGTEVETLSITVHPDTAKILNMVIDDVIAGARVQAYTLREDPELEPGEISVDEAAFVSSKSSK
jgi:hypothetical protein